MDNEEERERGSEGVETFKNCMCFRLVVVVAVVVVVVSKRPGQSSILCVLNNNERE